MYAEQIDIFECVDQQTEWMGSCWVYSVCVSEYVLVGGVDVSVDRNVSKLKCVMFCLRGLLAETGSLTLMMLNKHHWGTALCVCFSVFHFAAHLRHCWLSLNGQRCVESAWVMNIYAGVLLSTIGIINKEGWATEKSEDNSWCCITHDEIMLNQRGFDGCWSDYVISMVWMSQMSRMSRPAKSMQSFHIV